MSLVFVRLLSYLSPASPPIQPPGQSSSVLDERPVHITLVQTVEVHHEASVQYKAMIRWLSHESSNHLLLVSLPINVTYAGSSYGSYIATSSYLADSSPPLYSLLVGHMAPCLFQHARSQSLCTVSSVILIIQALCSYHLSICS